MSALTQVPLKVNYSSSFKTSQVNQIPQVLCSRNYFENK